MPLKNQDSVAASAFFAFCSLSVLYLSSRTLTGRTVLLWLRLHVWVFWLPMVMVIWAYRPLCCFFILCTTAIDFISLSCDLCEVLLKKYHSILAQCQTTLSVAFVLLETNLCGRCISATTLSYSFLPGFTIFDFRNHPATGILHKHLAQNNLSKNPN